MLMKTSWKGMLILSVSYLLVLSIKFMYTFISHCLYRFRLVYIPSHIYIYNIYIYILYIYIYIYIYIYLGFTLYRIIEPTFPRKTKVYSNFIYWQSFPIC